MASTSDESCSSNSGDNNGHQSSFDEDDFPEDRLSILLAAGAQEANYNKDKAKMHREKRQHKRTVSFADEQDFPTSLGQVDLVHVYGAAAAQHGENGGVTTVASSASNDVPTPNPHPRHLHSCMVTPSNGTDRHATTSSATTTKATTKIGQTCAAGTDTTTATSPSGGGNGTNPGTSPSPSPDPSSPSRKRRGHRRSLTNEYLRKMSSLLDDSPIELDVDSGRLNRCLADAGAYSAGIAAVEVWVLDEDETGALVRPPGGWWRNRDENILPVSEALAMLEDERHPNFVTADPVLPGVDLAGELWAESASGDADIVPGSGGTGGEKAPQASAKAAAAAIPGGACDEEMGDVSSLHPTNKAPPPFNRSSTCATELSGQTTARIVQGGEHDNDEQSGDEASKPGMDDSGHSRLSKWMTRSFDSRLAVRLTKSFDSRLAIRFGRATANALHLPGGHHHSTTVDGGNNDRGRAGWGEARASPQPHPRRALNWRDVPSLVANPDQARTPRLALLERAGLVSAAAVPFDVSNHRGIVVYYSTTAAEELNNATRGASNGGGASDARHLTTAMANQVYMIRSAHLVGSVIATTDARRASVALVSTRGIKVENSFSTGKGPNTGDFPLGGDTTDAAVKSVGAGHDKERSRDIRARYFCPDVGEQAGKRVRVWAQKCRGGNLQIPPPATMRQALWTLAGVFVGLLTLSGINHAIKLSSDGGNYVLLGPMGALMTLQYSLTAAPASQPRNAILGQAICGSIALLFTYVPEAALPAWIRAAVAPAVAISVMTKLGIVHPPAGAASVLLSSGRYGWVHYVGLVLSTVVSLLPAIAINNWSQKRQYPTYWGYLPVMVTNAVKKRAQRRTKSWKVTNMLDCMGRKSDTSIRDGGQRKRPEAGGDDELDSIA